MLDSQHLERTIKQLQSSGILFCIEYVGSVVVKKSVNSLSSEQQKEFARTCMQLVSKKSIDSLIEGERREDESIKYLKLPVQSFKKDVELNISSSAFIIIDSSTMEPLHRFKIQDVSLFSPVNLNKQPSSSLGLLYLFCFFAKDQNTNPPLRYCFVFNAQEELDDVRDAIYFAFKLNEHFNKIGEVNNGCLTQNRRDSDDIDHFVEENREEDAKTPIPCPTPPTPVLSEQTFFNNKNCGNNKCQNLLPPELPSIKSKQSLSNESCVNLAVHKRGRSESNFNGNSCSFRPSSERLQELVLDLSTQKWFHGVKSREESDILLCKNGQFLVRTSPSNPDRFVLVGMYNGKVVNICLLNNEGKQISVTNLKAYFLPKFLKQDFCSRFGKFFEACFRNILKTTAGEFQTIVNFINYFHHSRIPVIVDEKSYPILLLYPINR
ncbi:hypothetical protein Mgra_00003500 [Meloidogyne graminicola]|uniref:SH2 domain-containing protein n=1 Tax=Meloidogyne graminicola TaxID=189291 RepID=A0A8S9ZTT1_9BILA|nr:hypothetical protein Mgra_00003500 [Meloidogyne graminicola]